MSPLTQASRVEWSTQLAQALVQGGYETESNLAPLLAESRATGEPLATLLIGRNLALPGVVVGALAHLAQLPAVDLAAMTPSPEARAAMPDAVAQQHRAVALQFDGNVLAVAFSEPPTQDDVDALASTLGYRITPVLADPTVIAHLVGSGNGAVPPPGPAPSSPLVDAPPPSDDGEDDGEMASSKVEQLLQRGIPAEVGNDSVPLHIDDLLRYAVAVGA
jgi:MshEN domain